MPEVLEMYSFRLKTEPLTVMMALIAPFGASFSIERLFVFVNGKMWIWFSFSTVFH